MNHHTSPPRVRTLNTNKWCVSATCSGPATLPVPLPPFAPKKKSPTPTGSETNKPAPWPDDAARRGPSPSSSDGHGREPNLAAPDPLAAALLLPAPRVAVAVAVRAPPAPPALQEAQAPARACACADAAGRGGLLRAPAGARPPGPRGRVRLRRRGGQPRVPRVAGRAAAAPRGRGAARVRPTRQARPRGGTRVLTRGGRWRTSRDGEAARSGAVPAGREAGLRGGDGGRRAHVLGGWAAGGGRRLLPERGGPGPSRWDVQSWSLLP